MFSNEKERLLVFFVLIFKQNFALSHVPLRQEKDCLNCGTIVQGRYCHVCGQENIVPKETFWHMVIHFFYDITHFDSNFFHTVHRLIFKPGFLSAEYMKGRRARYLHPIKMYVFSSAVFFLLLFSVFKPVTVGLNMDQIIPPQERAAYIERLQNQVKSDTANIALMAKLMKARDTTQELRVRDTIQFDKNSSIVTFSDEEYSSMKEYDSIQASLPKTERDGWVLRRLVRKQIEINDKYRSNPDEAADKFAKSVLHRLPYMLFVSLPLFALILKLVYIRRKQFYYADHGVFTIHLYIFTFLMLMIIFALDKLDDLFNRPNLFAWVWLILFLGMFFYLYKAMRYFYGQGRGKTFVKFLIVSLFSIIMMLILLLIFMFFSAVTF